MVFVVYCTVCVEMRNICVLPSVVSMCPFLGVPSLQFLRCCWLAGDGRMGCGGQVRRVLRGKCGARSGLRAPPTARALPPAPPDSVGGVAILLLFIVVVLVLVIFVIVIITRLVRKIVRERTNTVFGCQHEPTIHSFALAKKMYHCWDGRTIQFARTHVADCSTCMSDFGTPRSVHSGKFFYQCASQLHKLCPHVVGGCHRRTYKVPNVYVAAVVLSVRASNSAVHNEHSRSTTETLTARFVRLQTTPAVLGDAQFSVPKQGLLVERVRGVLPLGPDVIEHNVAGRPRGVHSSHGRQRARRHGTRRTSHACVSRRRCRSRCVDGDGRPGARPRRRSRHADAGAREADRRAGSPQLFQPHDVGGRAHRP